MNKWIILLAIPAFVTCSLKQEGQVEIQELTLSLEQNSALGENQPGEFRRFLIHNHTDQELFYERTKNYKITFPSSRINFAGLDTIESIVERNWTEYEAISIKPNETDTLKTFLHYNTRNEDSSKVGFMLFKQVDSSEKELFITLTNLSKN